YLLGVEIDTEISPPVTGRSLNLTVWWVEREQDMTDYALFVHLFDAEGGQLVAQSDVVPDPVVEVGNVFGESLELALDNAPPGEYRLAIGFYDQSTGERLPLWGTDFDPTPDRQMLLSDVVLVQPKDSIAYSGVAPSETIAQKVELAYYAQLPSSQEQAALTEPVYLFDIYSPSGGYRLLVYVSAVD
ncbi:MAG: hypothetical protein PVF45_14805, partial [Anaerolineae bacterium]